MDIKKIIKIICLIIILIIVSISILYFVKSGNYKKTDEISELKTRVSQEIKFLDDYIFSIANSSNNINLKNYILKSETISGESTKESASSTSSSEGKGSQDNGGGQGSGGNEQKGTSKGNSNSYILQPSDILVNDRKADWESIKIAVERLHSTWSTIAIDLYKLNVDSQIIQGFDKNLDELTISVKDENKNNTLSNIAKIYDYLEKMGSYSFDNNLEVSMLRTKSNILKAYAIIEEEKWEEIKKYIKQAEDEYVNIIGALDKKNEYNANRAYILLKEFQSSIDSNNKDILYIKYKNLLDELNIVSV